jgi:hypothetical protein
MMQGTTLVVLIMNAWMVVRRLRLRLGWSCRNEWAARLSAGELVQGINVDQRDYAPDLGDQE